MRISHLNASQQTKHTPIGEIPAEWGCVALGKATDLLTGFPFPSDGYTDAAEGVRLLRGDNVIPGALRWTGVKRWPQSQSGALVRYVLAPGDVVLAMDRTWVGAGLKCAVACELDLPCLLVQRVARIRGKNDLLTCFVAQLLSTYRFSEYVRAVQTETAMPHISADQIRDFPIPLPPLPEQRKIAEILSTWDRAIEQTEKLIAAKQRLKQGLMQQLLTGRLRFPQFGPGSSPVRRTRFGPVPTDWHYVSIGDVAAEVSDRHGGDTSIPVLSCTKYDGLVDSLTYFGKRVFSEDTSGYKLVRRGQFAYATNHIEEGSIGVLTDAEAGLVSPMYTVFRTDPYQVDVRFLYSLLKTELYRHIFEVSTSASVDRRGSLRWNQFRTIRLALPALTEQRTIAACLGVAGQELDTMRRQLAALRQQKKGLMQKLLTGRVRVQAAATK